MGLWGVLPELMVAWACWGWGGFGCGLIVPRRPEPFGLEFALGLVLVPLALDDVGVGTRVVLRVQVTTHPEGRLVVEPTPSPARPPLPGGLIQPRRLVATGLTPSTPGRRPTPQAFPALHDSSPTPAPTPSKAHRPQDPGSQRQPLRDSVRALLPRQLQLQLQPQRQQQRPGARVSRPSG